MKWIGERVESFHHGETTQRRYLGLDNTVKPLLRAISFHLQILCAGWQLRKLCVFLCVFQFQFQN